MYKIAVMGDRASVYGFAALGLETHYVNDAAHGARILHRLSEECAVIYITEALAAELKEEISGLAQQPVPAVIPIPGIYGNSGIGMSAVDEAVIKAVGAEII